MSLSEWGPFESTADGCINLAGRSDFPPDTIGGPHARPELSEPEPFPTATYWQCIDPNTPWVCRSCLALSPDDPRHVPCWKDDE